MPTQMDLLHANAAVERNIQGEDAVALPHEGGFRDLNRPAELTQGGDSSKKAQTALLGDDASGAHPMEGYESPVRENPNNTRVALRMDMEAETDVLRYPMPAEVAAGQMPGEHNKRLEAEKVKRRKAVKADTPFDESKPNGMADYPIEPTKPANAPEWKPNS